MFSFCSLCRPEREPTPASALAAAPAAAAAVVPPPPQALLRSKSDGRILGASPPSNQDFIRSQSLPSASLLEAARRRMEKAAAERAAAEAAQAAAQHAALAESFVQQYMEVRWERWGRG